MSQITLYARAGRPTGSRASRRIRRSGAVPAVVYGKDLQPIAVSVDAHALQLALHTESGANVLINLEIEGRDSILTMARVIDRHPYRNEYRHIDFVKVSLEEKVRTEIPLHFVGTAVGVREGGVLSPRRTTVEVEALPTDLPSHIEVDISGVAIGESLRVIDLPTFPGVTYTEHVEDVVMSITAPAVEIEEEVELEEELVEGELEAEEEEAGAEEGEAESPE